MVYIKKIDVGTSAEKFSFFKVNSFLNTLTNHLNRYALTPTQLKVLSFIGFQSELNGSQPNLTMTKIAKDLDLQFTTAQRAIEKLGDGYNYKYPSGKPRFKAGNELIKHEKPEKGGGREGAISISTKGKGFLEDLGSVIADYSALNQI
jgi:DNA-binding MarR family transcriptional regulator